MVRKKPARKGKNKALLAATSVSNPPPPEFHPSVLNTIMQDELLQNSTTATTAANERELVDLNQPKTKTNKKKHVTIKKLLVPSSQSSIFVGADGDKPLSSSDVIPTPPTTSTLDNSTLLPVLVPEKVPHVLPELVLRVPRCWYQG
jgi:hypothetical protein